MDLTHLVSICSIPGSLLPAGDAHMKRCGSCLQTPSRPVYSQEDGGIEKLSDVLRSIQLSSIPAQTKSSDSEPFPAVPVRSVSFIENLACMTSTRRAMPEGSMVWGL